MPIQMNTGASLRCRRFDLLRRLVAELTRVRRKLDPHRTAEFCQEGQELMVVDNCFSRDLLEFVLEDVNLAIRAQMMAVASDEWMGQSPDLAPPGQQVQSGIAEESAEYTIPAIPCDRPSCIEFHKCSQFAAVSPLHTTA
jgi:hypothetical protein